MKIVVTGATGFIGNHLVPELLQRGHDVVAVARTRPDVTRCSWLDDVEFVAADVHALSGQETTRLSQADAAVHLAWPGLPNYRQTFHVDDVLPRQIAFLKSLIDGGLRHLLVAGTCFEYGLSGGCLDEATAAEPVTFYGLAKDALRRYLSLLEDPQDRVVQWARLFYLHGAGQSGHSLLAQLDRAIAAGNRTFDMSGGEQLRDYLPVSEAAHRLATLLEHPECDGIINLCSGTPVSIRSLVERHLKERGASIELNLGAYPYPPHEPMAFWGSIEKYQACCGLPRDRAPRSSAGYRQIEESNNK